MQLCCSATRVNRAGHTKPALLFYEFIGASRPGKMVKDMKANKDPRDVLQSCITHQKDFCKIVEDLGQARKANDSDAISTLEEKFDAIMEKTTEDFGDMYDILNAVSEIPHISELLDKSTCVSRQIVFHEFCKSEEERFKNYEAASNTSFVLAILYREYMRLFRAMFKELSMIASVVEKNSKSKEEE